MPPKEHFDVSMHKRDSLEQRKVGRPFKGQVEEYTKEPNVPERRSILRGFKKFFSRKEFEDIRIYLNKPGDWRLEDGNLDVERAIKFIITLDEVEIGHLQSYIDLCRNT